MNSLSVFKAERKPAQVSVIQFDGKNHKDVYQFAGIASELHQMDEALYAQTPDGMNRVEVSYYVVRDENKALSVFSPAEFIKHFTLVPDVAVTGVCESCGWPLEEHSAKELGRCQDDMQAEYETSGL